MSALTSVILAAVLSIRESAAPAPQAQRTPPLLRPDALYRRPTTSRRPLVIAPRRPRDLVVLSGVIEGPVALASTDQALFTTDENMLGQVGPDGYVRWTLLVGAVAGAPALDDEGAGYVASRDGALYAIAADGGQRWERRLGGGARGGVAVGPSRLAVSLDSGAVRWWRRKDGAPLGQVALGAVPAAAPVLTAAEHAIVATMDGHLVGLDPAGVRWRVRTPTGAAPGPLALGPIGDTVYAGTADGWVVTVSADGRQRWQVSVGAPVVASPVLAEGGAAIYIAAGEGVVALSPEGAILWRAPAGGALIGSPLVADDGTVYGLVATAEKRGAVIGISPDGQRTTRRGLPAPPAPSLSLANHRLWVGLRDGTIRRLPVPQRGLARSAWAKARGDIRNTGMGR